MPATGPDFISFQARDLDVSQAFYEQYLGLVRSPVGPPHAVVFETKPIAFALRDVLPGTDLAAVAQPGIGAAIWLHATDVQAITMLWPPTVTPSSPHRSTARRSDLHLRRPDGYQVTSTTAPRPDLSPSPARESSVRSENPASPGTGAREKSSVVGKSDPVASGHQLIRSSPTETMGGAVSDDS